MNTKYNKINLWGLVFLLYPFVSSFLFYLFARYIYLIRPHSLSILIENIAGTMILYSVFAIFFGISATIGVITLIKTKGHDLLAISMTAISLLFLYACIFLW